MTGPVDRHVPWWTCECGKRAYQSRSEAKTVSRQMTNADRKVRAYECDVSPGVYHLTSELTSVTTWYRENVK